MHTATSSLITSSCRSAYPFHAYSNNIPAEQGVVYRIRTETSPERKTTMAAGTKRTRENRTSEQKEAQQELIEDIKGIHNKRGLSREKFANDVGISLRALDKIEKGVNIPSGNTIYDITRLSGMDHELRQRILSLAKAAGSRGIEKTERNSPQLGGIIYFLLPKLEGRFWPGFLTAMMLREVQLSDSAISHSRATVNMEFLLSVSCHQEDWWQLRTFLQSINSSYFKTKGIIVAPPRSVKPDPRTEGDNQKEVDGDNEYEEDIETVIKEVIQLLIDLKRNRTKVLVLDKPFYIDNIDEPSELQLVGFRDRSSPKFSVKALRGRAAGYAT